MVHITTPDRGILLSSVLAGSLAPDSAQLAIQSCSCDSRHILPGDLYVALVGHNYDGHDFAHQAVARGAVAVLAERPLPIHDVPVLVVEDARQAYGQICQALAGWPANDLQVIGVTGTNGKTTTAALIAVVINVAGGRAGALSTLGYSDSQTTATAVYTTPPPPLLAQWLAQMAASYCTHAVLEVSSHALAQYRLSGMQLNMACITNITRAHLYDHNTFENYRQTKARMIQLLDRDGLVVLNADDPVSTELIPDITVPVLTVGIERPAEITATRIDQNLCGQSFLITAGEETAAVQTRMIGSQHVYNCLQATAIGLAYGIDLTTIARGLERVEILAGRMERIDCGQDFAAFVDAAKTPHALAAAIHSLQQVTAGRLICVVGADGWTDRDERQRLARTAEQLADTVIITTNNPEDRPPQWIAADLVDGLECPAEVPVILDRQQAIEHALSAAAPNDTVLITGRGHEPDQRLGHQRIPFDDRDVVRAILAAQETFTLPWRTAA